MDICSKCKVSLIEHAVCRVSIDVVRRDSDSYLKRSLEQNWGICNVRFDYLEGTIIITFNPLIISTERIKRALATPGFVLEKTYWRWLLINCRLYSHLVRMGQVTILLAISWILTYKFGLKYQTPATLWTANWQNWAYMILNMTIILLVLLPRLDSLIDSIKSRKGNIDILVFIASIGAVLSGFWLEAATFLLAMVFADAFNELIIRKSTEEIAMAAVASAKNAYVIEGGTSRRIPVHEVKAGQLIEVKHGMFIPIDGIIQSGDGRVNEAAITGENAFAAKSEGDRVYAGTLLESGAMVIEATAVGHDTELGNIIKLIEKAEKHEHPNIQTTVDNLTGYLTILIISYSIISFLFFLFFQQAPLIKALARSVAILFSACPLALAFCASTALHAGLNAAARLGVLFKDGTVIEKLARTKALLIDKTGTLTHARPVVYEVKTFGGYTLNKVIRTAAAVESHSYHPLALAVCEYAAARNLTPERPEKFIELNGAGTCAYIGGRPYRVGAKWMIATTVPITPPIQDWIDESARHGLVTALIANDREIIGGFRFSDQMREEAPFVINRLRKLGMKKIVMITGDNRASAARIAQKLHLDEYYAECMPEMKLEKLEEIKKVISPVAMIGDGINDAPVIAEADIGIAIAGTGADAAIVAADVALTGDYLGELSIAYGISKQIFNIIKVNIVVALLLNLVVLGLVTAGAIGLMLATVIFSAGTILVICNSYLSVIFFWWKR